MTSENTLIMATILAKLRECCRLTLKTSSKVIDISLVSDLPFSRNDPLQYRLYSQIMKTQFVLEELENILSNGYLPDSQ